MSQFFHNFPQKTDDTHEFDTAGNYIFECIFRHALYLSSNIDLASLRSNRIWNCDSYSWPMIMNEWIMDDPWLWMNELWMTNDFEWMNYGWPMIMNEWMMDDPWLRMNELWMTLGYQWINYGWPMITNEWIMDDPWLWMNEEIGGMRLGRWELGRWVQSDMRLGEIKLDECVLHEMSTMRNETRLSK